MRLLPKFLLFTVLLAVLASAGPNMAQKARIASLENAVLAPCCYAEPVSRHNSEIALRMKMEIARLVEAGETDADILNSYVALYGQKVLVDPNSAPPLWSQWAPWALTVAGTIALAALVFRWRKRLPPAVSAANSELPDVSDITED